MIVMFHIRFPYLVRVIQITHVLGHLQDFPSMTLNVRVDYLIGFQ